MHFPQFGKWQKMVGLECFPPKTNLSNLERKYEGYGGLKRKLHKCPISPNQQPTHGHIMLLLFLHPFFFFFFFLIGNQRTNINEKKNEKYKMFMMMNNRKQMKQTANKGEGN